jgi:hypothetical protein
VKFILILSSLFAFTGCVATLEPEKDVSTNLAFVKEFTFPAEDIEGNQLKESEIISSLSTEILANTSYPKYQRIEKGGDGIFHTKGVTTNFNQISNTLEVSYLNGKEYFYSGEDQVSKIKTQITFQTDYTKNGYILATLSVNPTVKVQLVSTSMDGFENLVTPENAVRDTINALSLASPAIGRKFKFSSQAITPYPAESVFSNFVTATESQPYLLSKGSLSGIFYAHRVPVTISVLPYRDGSRVIYSFDIPYSLLGDGQHTLSQNLVARVEKTIEETAAR